MIEKEYDDMEKIDMCECACCGNSVSINEVTLTRDGWVCDSCLYDDYAWCSECEEWSRKENMCQVRREYHVCIDCINQSYTICDDCGEYTRDDEIEIIDGENYCPDCVEYHMHNDIDDYQHTKAEFFLNLPYEPYTEKYFGIELEVDSHHDVDDINDIAREIKTYFPNTVQIKYDGSLIYGFEMAWQPMTWNYIQNNNNFWKMMNYIKTTDLRSHDVGTCGLHIHVSRKFFGETSDEQDLCAAKLIILVNSMWDDLVKFSRRNYEDLDRWSKKNEFEIGDVENPIEIAYKSNGDRYYAVNLTNCNTIEFRMFRGTLNYNTFVATLELVDILTEFAKNSTVLDCQKMDKLTKLTKNGSVNLMNYIEKRGIK